MFLRYPKGDVVQTILSVGPGCKHLAWVYLQEARVLGLHCQAVKLVVYLVLAIEFLSVYFLCINRLVLGKDKLKE